MRARGNSHGCYEFFHNLRMLFGDDACVSLPACILAEGQTAAPLGGSGAELHSACRIRCLGCQRPVRSREIRVGRCLPMGISAHRRFCRAGCWGEDQIDGRVHRCRGRGVRRACVCARDALRKRWLVPLASPAAACGRLTPLLPTSVGGSLINPAHSSQACVARRL